MVLTTQWRSLTAVVAVGLESGRVIRASPANGACWSLVAAGGGEREWEVAGLVLAGILLERKEGGREPALLARRAGMRLAFVLGIRPCSPCSLPTKSESLWYHTLLTCVLPKQNGIPLIPYLAHSCSPKTERNPFDTIPCSLVLSQNRTESL